MLQNQATFTGAMNGDIYMWRECQLERVVQKAHAGPVFSLYTTLKDGFIVSGAKERSTPPGSAAAQANNGPVKLWDADLRRPRAFQLETESKIDVVKSVCRTRVRNYWVALELPYTRM